jgi:MFS family permease
MISTSYIASAIGVVIVGWLFQQGTLGATGLTIGLSIVFFFASAGASAGYLTVSEIFPLEIRANAIAFFYAIGSAIGGIVGPLLFGALVGTGDKGKVLIGYAIGGLLMLVGGVMEIFFGIDAEQSSLEDVATPLSETDASSESTDTASEQDQLRSS